MRKRPNLLNLKEDQFYWSATINGLKLKLIFFINSLIILFWIININLLIFLKI